MKPVLFLISVLFILTGCKPQDLSSKVIVAHRGASGYLPEHSLASVAAAHIMNPQYIEQDVVMTKDNQLVVLHDPHIDTTTNVKDVFPNRKRKDGRYYSIDFTLKELKALKLSERFKAKTGEQVYPRRFPKFKSSFSIPTLAEEIELIQGLNHSRNKNIGFYVEIKAPEFHKENGKNILEAVVKELKKYGYSKKTDNIYIQCFHFDSLKKLNQLTDIKLVQLVAENSWQETSTDYDFIKSSKGVEELVKVVDGVGPWWKQLIDINKETKKIKPSAFYKELKKHKLSIHPYTFRVDQVPQIFKSYKDWVKYFLVKLDVDGLFTDFPDQTKQITQ